MKKTAINILVLVAVFAIAWFTKGKFSPTVVDNTVTDTVLVDKPYPVEKIVEKEVPVRVTEYKTKYDTVTQVLVEKDTVFVSTDLNTFAYDARFLVSYPQSPRFLGLQFANQELGLTYQKTNGTTRTKTWNVGDRGYRVGLNDGQPNIETFKENTTDFSYSVEAGYIRFISWGSPYLEFSSEFRTFGVGLTGTVGAARNPYGKIGVKHEF